MRATARDTSEGDGRQWGDSDRHQQGQRAMATARATRKGNSEADSAGDGRWRQQGQQRRVTAGRQLEQQKRRQAMGDSSRRRAKETGNGQQGWANRDEGQRWATATGSGDGNSCSYGLSWWQQQYGW